ncbi:MAG: type II toxin-antitoxin system RelB/DinJ family antitoxin [Spirochaetaceae bacterium]|jgi:DNA-damage-inducible protein J|nr:type II toxin-antitoxin system RelB/DinJ family antitoxin [Spirochaetaceae bacterium]
MAQVNIRIDNTLKEEADHLFEELGMNLSTAFTIFIRQALRQRGIPFMITADPDSFYNPVNMKWLEQSIEQGKQGRYIVKTMEELERMADE